MNEQLRAGEETQEMINLRAMSDKLINAVEQLSQWKVELDYAVQPNVLDLKITARKPNGNGFIKTVPYGDIEYYENDPDALSEQIIDDIVAKLLRPQLQQMIKPSVSRAVANIIKMGKVQ